MTGRDYCCDAEWEANLLRPQLENVNQKLAYQVKHLKRAVVEADQKREALLANGN